jgi:hypothetical protein
MKPKCLIICYTNLGKDPRVIKHFEALKDTYEVYTAGISPIGSEKKFVSIREYNMWEILNNEVSQNRYLYIIFLLLKPINFFRFKVINKLHWLRYWNLRRIIDYFRLLFLRDIELIVCNDINTLPLAASIKSKGATLVYDAHEFHPEEYGENNFWVKHTKPYIIYLYQRYLKFIDKSITVGDAIAKQYKKEYNLDCAVVLNAPPLFENYQAISINTQTINIVYSGMFGPNRNFEELFKMIDCLPHQYHLHLLVTNANDKLMGMINQSPSKSRIFIHPPVKLNDVVTFLSRFDIGVHLMPSSNFNNDNALPNKYFQYVQARLVTAFGPLSEVTRYTQKYKTGIIAEKFEGESVAKAILDLSNEEIQSFKIANNTNSKLFNEALEVNKLKEIYTSI